MSDIALNSNIEKVKELENVLMQMPQVHIDTDHVFHAGTYSRTIMIPKGICITGAEIKIDTLLIVSGDVMIGDVRVTGYHILQGNKGRKNAFLALEDTYLTMIFATNSTNIEEVEQEFTNDYERLGSRRNIK